MAKHDVTFVRPSDPPSNELPRTFVDNYTDWASTVTDAPVQYHRATGVTMLSTIMTPYLSLPTSFGTFIPNIWMMVLAGTTMTRKSTSLNLAAKLLNDVTDDWMLATDGSPEGILQELAYRDGKISVFLRDEITGFMSSVSQRDYLSGLLEAFTQLYDCVPQTRLLRKERVEIKQPYFVFMGGGIKTRMEEIVSMEHIRSGFIPRFLFVTGSTTRDQVRPIGPPAEEELRQDGESPRDLILNELWRIHEFYTREDDGQDTKALIKIAGVPKVSTPKQKKVTMKGTPEFWRRLVELNDDAMDLGEHSSAPELYTPLYTRLGNTVMKVSMLLAGAEFSDTIELHHLQKAIALSQEWIETVTGFAHAIEQQPDMDKWEKKAEKIISWVKTKDPEPLTQTQIMQKFRIRKRDIDDIEATLMARGVIKITPYPHARDMRGGQIKYSVSDQITEQRGRPRTKIEKEDTYHATAERHEVDEEGRGIRRQRNGRRVQVPLRASASASQEEV